MKRLQLVSAIFASVCAASAYAAQPNQTFFVQQQFEGSNLQPGDTLVADGQGNAALYRGNTLLATVHDPDDLISKHSAKKPLYITDVDGARSGALSTSNGDLFLSEDAPVVIHAKKELNNSKQPQGAAAGNTANDMTWHNGTILVSNKTMAIFWGDWSNPGDVITGMDTFFQGWGGSGMAGDSTEYTGSNGQVTSSSAYLGHVFDTSSPPKRALTTSGAVAEACKMTNNNPDPNGVYFVFTSTGAGHVSYCAWHSYGTCSNGAPVQVAYMPNLTGVTGCDPSDTWTTHSEPLAAIASVTSHELSETITDPRNGGWYDSSNQENGDKCAWSFNNVVTLANGSQWKLQMEWSNKANDAGTGYLNRSGQPGCLQ
jgi:hypothetical protein